MINSKNSRYPHLIIIVLFCCMAYQSFAQKNSLSSKVSNEDELSAKYIVTRTPPKGFSLVENPRVWTIGDNWGYEFWDKAWKLRPGKRAMVCAAFQSKDKQCELYFNYLKYDENFYYHSMKKSASMSLLPRNTIKADLTCALNGKSDFSFDDYVDIISGDEAKQRFNADSVFVWGVPIEPIVQDGQVYKYCTYMYIHKQSRVMLSFVWLFTEKGEKNKQKYIDKLDKNVWYKEGEIIL